MLIELKCENCGAPLNASTLECEYCGTRYVKTENELQRQPPETIVKNTTNIKDGERIPEILTLNQKRALIGLGAITIHHSAP